MDKESIVLGSGTVYIKEFTGTIPDDADIETDECRLGRTKEGASIEYTAETVTETDDYQTISKTVVTSEEALLKLGVFGWTGDTLAKLCATARVTTDTAKKRRVVKIGGTKNDNGKSYVIRFVHEDAEDGDIRITIVGRNSAGFTLAFAMDAGTKVEPEFKAEPTIDKDGTLIIYEEDIIEDTTRTE